ncbi:hypothetical protein CBS76997_11456 [Aspergillus niger]|nr:hypothetical protein CBS13152_11439 [Aspergillus niger]KAI2945716.1 hypothetical protein CBS147323_11283 [Aspergillus niger]KAI3030901.1 hypothetical protein CBS76997_11456 [Aspergillus niger]
MASAERPRILLLSLAYRDFLDEVYCTLFSRLSELANIKRAKTANAALQIIGETTFKAIIITDEGLAESNQENQEVLVKIKAYVEKGGIAIVGLHFPNFTPMDKFRRFFEAFGLAWKNGDYHRTTFRLNPSVFLPESIEAASLPGPYSMKVLHVKNAKRQEKIFIPIEGAVTQSLVFPPDYVNQTQAAVAGARLGWGYLIYCGDVNGEDGSNQLILALCGF